MTHERRWLLAGFAAALLLCSAAMGAAGIEIVNSSMEEIPKGKTFPTGYSPFGKGIAVVDHHVAYEGSRSVKTILAGPKEMFGFVQQAPVSMPAGKQTRIRARVRTHELKGEAYLMVYRYPPPFKGAFYSTKRLSGTNGWTQIEAVVPAKKGGNMLQIRMLVYGTTGRAWWDKLEAVVEDKP